MTKAHGTWNILTNRIIQLSEHKLNKGIILPSIGFDNYVAMKKLIEYVVSLSHTNIGMISARISEKSERVHMLWPFAMLFLRLVNR